MIVVHALYGLKSSGTAFRTLLVGTLYDIGYTPSKADPDVWLRPAVKPDGFEYYKMILCYVDDVLSILHDAMQTMKGIQNKFKLKDDKIGTGLSKMMTANVRKCWSMSPEKYCKAAVLNVEHKLNKEGKRLPNKCKTPLKSVYRPDLDVPQELKAYGVQYNMEIIGVLRWKVEIEQVDILYETSIM